MSNTKITEHQSIYHCPECKTYDVERIEYDNSKFIVRCKNCKKAIYGNVVNQNLANLIIERRKN